jgi:hypothetical protein
MNNFPNEIVSIIFDLLLRGIDKNHPVPRRGILDFFFEFLDFVQTPILLKTDNNALLAGASRKFADTASPSPPMGTGSRVLAPNNARR